MKFKLILAMMTVTLTAFFGAATAQDATPSHNHMGERGGAIHAKQTSSTGDIRTAAASPEKSNAVSKKVDKHNHRAERGGYVGSTGADAAK
jgi:hypothetical protein